MKEAFFKDYWGILAIVIGALASLGTFFWIITQFKDRRKNKKAKQIRDSAKIKNLFEAFHKWLNEDYIFYEESFEKKEMIINKYKCFSFPASLSELEDIQKSYGKLLFDYDIIKDQQRIIFVKQERYDLYQRYQRDKADKYRKCINEKWKQLQSNLNEIGYKSLKDIKFLEKEDKKKLEGIENLKDTALSVNDEIFRKRN